MGVAAFVAPTALVGNLDILSGFRIRGILNLLLIPSLLGPDQVIVFEFGSVKVFLVLSFGFTS